MLLLKKVIFIFGTLFLAACGTVLQAQIPGNEAAGSWNVTIESPEGEQPGWLEIKTSGAHALVGRYVGPSGSARPISKIDYAEEEETYSFTIPPQWMEYENDPHFEFSLKEDQLKGWTTDPEGNELQWTAVRAPSLDREEDPEWGEPIELIDSELSKWIIPANNQFQMEEGVMVNKKSGGNLVTEQEFDDFKLHVEFRYPEGSNSGIYLRGRYEVQVIDSYGMKPESHILGGIYGFIEPSVNAAKKAGEWQTYDITLTGRMVTVELNGTKVICNRPIPGITGGALDSHEGEPGPIMIQGDHGPVEYRNMTITPAQ